MNIHNPEHPTLLARLRGAWKPLLLVTAVALTLISIDYERIDMPGPDAASPARQPFAWDRDAYWDALEARYDELRLKGCPTANRDVMDGIGKANALLRGMDKRRLDPDAPEFAELERSMFELAPLVGGCGVGLGGYAALVSDVRSAVKRQSERWDMDDDDARATIYRLLYGGRAALEEVIAHSPDGSLPSLMTGTDEPSATPSVIYRGVTVHSGDILVSRGGAPTSALIARGNDYPGNFSHIALVYVDPEGHNPVVVESHIESGVSISTPEQYFADKKLRVMLLRPRADLPAVAKDPMLPHSAAEYEYKRASGGHIPYDFAMDGADHGKLFCSEVASEAYGRYGVGLWSGVSHISSPGIRRWLGWLGVRQFETQEPSDLEYDPQLSVVAEWRDPDTLRQDRMDNAVTDVMLEAAEAGQGLSMRRYMLPALRAAKAYSFALNLMGMVGPVPEGMSGEAAWRTDNYRKMHAAIKERLIPGIEGFRAARGYEPPYWELVKLAREARDGSESH